MPGFDRTGPRGGGPMTGGGRGYCMSSEWVGRPRTGWGGGYGRGRGWRHRFWATGIPGRGWWGTPPGYTAASSPEEEIKVLQEEAGYLEKELKEIRRSIDALKKQKSEDADTTNS